MDADKINHNLFLEFMDVAMVRRKPRLGIALGAGSARGWAHIGVLQDWT